jgi:Protein of unknown function (DUF4197)
MGRFLERLFDATPPCYQSAIAVHHYLAHIVSQVQSGSSQYLCNLGVFVMSSENETQRRAFLWGLIAASFGGAAAAQSNAKILEDLARAALARGAGTPASGTSPTPTGGVRGGLGLSLGDADGGIRQALGSAALASALRLGRLDGYWADGKVRIPLPDPLNSLQSRLKPLRLSTPLDNFQMRLNRAAETAAPRAGAIFTDTIKSLTISDAIQIVRGGDTAGTDMLKSRATTQLTTLLTPPMASAVDSSGAGAALDRINARYSREIASLGGLSGLAGYGRSTPATTNATPSAPSSAPAAASGPLIFGAGATPASTTSPIPASTGVTPAASGQANSLKTQMIGFAVAKALDGLFFYVGEEERAIRSDPAKRTTDLLRRVFGGL